MWTADHPVLLKVPFHLILALLLILTSSFRKAFEVAIGICSFSHKSISDVRHRDVGRRNLVLKSAFQFLLKVFHCG